jgi:hypothetical protein
MMMTYSATDGRSQLTAIPDSPNSVLISVQIEVMQEVLRRMKAAQSPTLDPVTSEKLERLKNN